MPTVRTDDGVRIAYKTSGIGPRNIVFLHGWAGSGAYWDEMLKHLDLTGMRVISVDYRGHGNSDKATTGYTQERFAKDVFAVADHAKADKVVLVGFSMSGKFAQYMSCVEPNRAVGQILVAGCPASEIPFPAETHLDWVSRVGNREKMIELTKMFITQPVKTEVLERWADDAVKVPQVALDETLNMATRTSFVDRLKMVRKPTLVVGGAHDPIFTPDVLRQGVVAPLCGARLALLDSNHEIPIEKPQELAAVIEAFLAGLA